MAFCIIKLTFSTVFYIIYDGDVMIEITKIRHDYPEKAGFNLVRPNGHPKYTFLHFLTPVEIIIKGKTVFAKPGACVIFSPKEPQFFKSNHPLLHNWFHAEDTIKPLLSELEIPENELFYPSDTSFISPLMQRAELEFFSQDKLKNKMLDAIISELLCSISRVLNSPSTPKIQAENFDKMRTLRQQILLNPEKRWTIEEMARTSLLSTSRFHNVYKSVFGTSPIRDLIEARINYAKSILLSEDISVLEVSEKAGYNDQYQFIRQFKKETGVTPQKFRKQNML